MREDLQVIIDPVRVLQVLGNLISNAIKLTPAGGTVRISCDATAEEVTFSVADSGPGVSGELAPRIFDRFAGSTGAAGGLGLGLFISKRLVEAQGGRLWLDSDPPWGAVFRFTLRRASD